MAGLKIGIFSDFVNPDIGGHAASIYSLAKEIERQGNRVTVFCLNDKRNFEIDLDKIYITTKGRTSLGQFFIPSYFLAKIAKRSENDFDLFHSNIGFGFFYVFYRGRKPFILHLRGEHLKNIRANFSTPTICSIYNSVFDLLFWLTEIFVIPKSDLIFCNSEFTLEYAKKNSRNNKQNVILLPNGVDMSDHISQEKLIFQRAGEFDKNKIIGCISRLDYGKGNIFRFIDVMKLIRKERTDIQLLIAGNGPWEEQLNKTIARENLASCVKLVGHVSHKKINQFFNIIDLHIPATAGRSVIEGMASAKPFILLINNKDPSGIPMVGIKSENIGIIFDEYNRIKLANEIMKRIDDDEWLEQHGIKAKEYIIRNLTWKAIAKKTIEYYQIVIKKTY